MRFSDIGSRPSYHFYSHFRLASHAPLPRLHVDGACSCTGVVAMLAACTITPPPSLHSILTIPSITRSGNLDQYRVEVAHRVAERNPSGMLHGIPQAMLRSLVVVAFTVDGSGRLVNASVTQHAATAKRKRLAQRTLRSLPPPPSRLLDGNGRLELMEGWLFNDDGHFQLQHRVGAGAIDRLSGRRPRLPVRGGAGYIFRNRAPSRRARSRAPPGICEPTTPAPGGGDIPSPSSTGG